MPTLHRRTRRRRSAAVGRVFTRWTTDDLEVAEALTNGGSLQRAADLCWALIGDGRVRGALETRVKGLLRLPSRGTRRGDGRSAGRVVRALEAGDWYDAPARPRSRRSPRGASSSGSASPARLDAAGWSWLGCSSRTTRGTCAGMRRTRRWRVRTAATGEVDIVPGDRRWALYAPSCSGTPTATGVPGCTARGAAAPDRGSGKHFAWGDWMHHSEVHGSPISTWENGTDPSAAPSKGRARRAGQHPRRHRRQHAIGPPPGIPKLALLEPSARLTWEQFPQAISAASIEVAIAITGQSSSTEIVAGQDTGATLHGRVRQDLIEGDAQTLSTCLHDQALVDYAEINYGARALAPWPRGRLTRPRTPRPAAMP